MPEIINNIVDNSVLGVQEVGGSIPPAPINLTNHNRKAKSEQNPLALNEQIGGSALNFTHDVQEVLGKFGNRPKLEVPKEIEFLRAEVFEVSASDFNAIYFLCDGNEVVYVGKSSNPLTRICTHRNSWIKFNRAFILPVLLTGSFFSALEAQFINWLQPRFNRSKSKLRVEPSGLVWFRLLADMGVIKPGSEMEHFRAQDIRPPYLGESFGSGPGT